MKNYIINEQMNREIRFLGPDDLDDYLPIYLNAYPAGKSIGDEGYAAKKERSLEIMAKDKGTHFVGLYENGNIIATMKLIDFTMNVFGKMQPACGLMALGVDPMHKKKGAALDMVKYFEHYTREIGASLALLLPFRIDFYRKMGYGFETRLHEYRLPTRNLPKCRDAQNLRILGKSDFAEICRVYESYTAANHGALGKFGEEARDMEEDTEVRRIGYAQDGKLKGYVAFHFASDNEENYTINRMEVDEIIYENGKVFRALLGGLRLQADLAQTVVLRTGEEDFYHLLEDPQDIGLHYIPFGYLQTNVSAIGVMHKIVDVEKFIEDTKHRRFLPMELTVGFEYEDAMKHEIETLALKFTKDNDGKASHWSMATQDTKPEVMIECTQAEFGSILMGSCSVAALARMDVIRISDEAYIETLDYLFHYKQHAFTNTDF